MLGHDTIDPELDSVEVALRAQDPDGSRFSKALRRTIDMLLDGQNTGRFRWEQLYKTEKTHAGTLIEINLHREFHFGNGDKMDYKIDGVDVDCKFSQDLWRWMIPPEAVGHICLLTWCNDRQGKWSAGLLRVTEERLSAGKNRDGKRNINQSGRSAIRWLFHEAPLPENVLLRLSPDDIEAIFRSRFGQQRINELFRRTLGRRVGRAVVATVGQQDDYMKRIRYNGGARSALAPEGIVILGQYRSHVEVAAQLSLPLPRAGESVSVRLTRWFPDDGDVLRVQIGSNLWRIAKQGEIEHAPRLPET